MSGVSVVIDVLRAFTTAAFAFRAGASQIFPVSSVEHAFVLRKSMPGALLMGEVHGESIPGFDFGNSPEALKNLDLSGVRLIQRTSAGTQGIERAKTSELLLASSLCCAGATARYIAKQAVPTVTFLLTGQGQQGERKMSTSLRHLH